MNSKLRGKKQGFTIIEVVLVLAIAGLIFLIVFLALPGLQKSRRDTQRKSDVGKILAQVAAYASDHKGDYPAAVSLVDTPPNKAINVWQPTYFDAKDYSDPSTHAAYNVRGLYTYALVGNDLKIGDIYYYHGVKCPINAVGSNGIPATDANSTMVATKLETGGVYCQDTGS